MISAMWKSLDRYILKEIASPFLIGLSVYTFTLLINNIMLLSHTLVAKAASTATILNILLYLLPDLLAFTIPMSTLMGVLAGFSRMSSDSETIALKTMGINNRRLLWPVMLFCLGTWLLSSYLIMFLAPEANFRLNRLLTRVSVSRAVSTIKPRTFYRELPFVTLYFSNINDASGIWENVFVYSVKSGDTDSVILAPSGRFVHSRENDTSHLLLQNARVHSYKRNNPEETYSLTHYSLLKEDVSSRVEMNFARKSHQLVFPELLKRKQKKPDDILLGMELHNKFALPFTCLLFGVLGLSLGLSTQKGGKISGFILSLVIIFVYYTISTAARSLILKETLSPGVGMWTANIFLIIIGVLLFQLNSRERNLPRVFKRKASVRKNKQQRQSRKPFLVVTVQAFRLRLLKRIDHYVSRRILLTFLLTYVSLMLVFFIIGIVELVDDVVDNGVPFYYTLQYVIYNAPSVSAFTIPVSLLTAVLLSYSWMSKNNEITAIQISGTSLHRLALPALWIGMLFSVAAFFLQERITPDANRRAEETLNIIHKRENPTLKEREKNWVESKDNTFYFYNHLNQRTQVIHQFNMLKLDPNFKMGKRVFAKTAAWVGEKRLQLTDGFQRRFQEGTPADFSAFESLELPVPEGRDFFFHKVAYTQHMNIRELRNYIHYLEENRSDTQRFRAELFQKYAFPFSSLIMVLIAIPFSFMMGSKGTLYGIGIAVGFSMIFWGIVGMFNSLGTATLLSPALSAFAPLILFAALSMGLFLQVRT